MTDLPSYKLVQRLMHESGFPVADPNDEMVFPEAKFMKLASRLIQYGADQELEACEQVIIDRKWFAALEHRLAELHNARRPKPPSLKEQALLQLDTLNADLAMHGRGCDLSQIRRALEALPND